MSTIRHYIDLVEYGFQQPAFGQKGVMPGRGPEPTNPKVQGELEQARKYSTAEAYADEMNPITPMNTDPPKVRDMWERENDRLLAKWNHWKTMGLI
jgi:hypothetical protein